MLFLGDQMLFLGYFTNIIAFINKTVKIVLTSFWITKDIWNSRQIYTKSKYGIFNCNVKSKPLYGTETSKVTEITNKLRY